MSTPPRHSIFAWILPPRPGTNGNAKRPGEFIRTLPVVVFLTVLIWVYAERAQTRDDLLTVRFDLQATDPNLDVDVRGASDDRLSISVNGPRGQIELLRNRLESAPLAGRIRVPLSAGESTAGEKNVDLVARLNEMPLFSNSGVTVSKTSPAQVRAFVDQVVSKNLKVVLPKDLPVTLQNFKLSPEKIIARGPSAAINNEFPGDNPTITLDVSSLRNVVTAIEQTRELPIVEPPKDSRIELSTNKVRMAFEIGSTIVDDTVPTVAILVERPLGDEGKFKVVMRRGPVINNVKIRGPANLVAKYVGDQREVLQAVLKVEQADTVKGEISRQVTFPYKDPGITILNEPIEVVFDVVDLTP